MAHEDGSYDVIPTGSLPSAQPLSPDSTEPSQDEQQPETAYNVGDAIGKQNITDLFSDQELKNIASDCMADFEIDENNFKSRKERIEELYKLALQVKEPKNYPFEGSSNVKYPLLTKAALSFSAMAYPAIVKDNTVVKGAVVGNDDGDEQIAGPDDQPMIDPDTNKPMRKNAGLKAKRADRVATFMSNQVLDDIDGWEDDMDKIVNIIPIIGCAFKKSFQDSSIKKNVSKLVLPQYLIISLHAKTMETAFRVSEILDLYPNEIEENIRMGLFREFDYSLQSTKTQADSYKPQPGPSASADSDQPHQFIETHRWLDLDKDGYKEPYIVWIHRETREAVRIMARFDHDDIIAGSAITEPGGVTLYTGIKRIKAETYYTKFGFMPDPEGSIYDIGFGHLLQHLNEAANTSINQLIDAGHRNIMGGGFIGSGLKIKSGDTRFRPGEYKRADSQGMALKDSIVPLPMPEPSTVMMALMEFLIQAAESIAIMTKAQDIPANTNPSVGLAIIEQGLQPFKAVFKRVHRALKQEFQRLYYLNQKYLTQDAYMAVLSDPDADVEKDFLSGSVAVHPVSDPDMVNNIEMIMRAQILENYKDDPMVDGIEVRKRIFKAVNIKDVDSLVKIPPKVTDELVEAQKAALESQTQLQAAQIEKLSRDNERDDIEMALKIEQAMASIQVDVSNAVLNLAKAEQADHGIKIDQFMANLKALETRMKTYGDTAGRISTAGQAGNVSGSAQPMAQPSNQSPGAAVSP